MDKYLLAGAGFSKSWNASLASEFWSYLYDQQAIQENNKCKEIFLSESNFETAYETILKLKDPTAQEAILTALRASYTLIDNQIMNSRHCVRRNVQGFLERFINHNHSKVAIFTLNQDLLLERY